MGKSGMVLFLLLPLLSLLQVCAFLLSTFFLLVSGRVIQIPSINVVQKLDGQQL